MKPLRSRLDVRYRNDAIYRSAERLLEAPPRPAKKPSPRWLIFSGGLFLGVALALVLALRVSREPLKIGSAFVSSIFNYKFPPMTVRGRQTASSTTAPIAPALALPSSTTPGPGDAVQAFIDAARRNLPAVAPRPSPSGTAPTAATPQPQLVSTPVPAIESEVTLRGELRSLTAEPMPIELLLIRTTGTDYIRGFDRYLRENEAFAGNQIKGEAKQRTIELRETSAVVNAATVGTGRQFVIQLPERNSGASELTGTWSLGPTSGTLVLSTVAPR